MDIVKIIHVYSAYITGLGYLFRGILAVMQHPALDRRALKTIPHIVDTCLFASGLTMMFTWALWPSSNPWLLAKLIALLLYIGCGLLMLRWGNTSRNRWLGLVGGMMVYIYIVLVAHGKSALPIT